MTSEELKLRTKKFARRCVKLSEHLPKNFLGNYLAGQLIRSSLSVAANYRAVCIAQSKSGFAAKISIVLEETDECEFWISFIEDENLIESKKLADIKQESQELTKIFAASRITSRKNQKNVNTK
jgi:four helix bundle protein